jgi:hypothetical protein
MYFDNCTIIERSDSGKSARQVFQGHDEQPQIAGAADDAIDGAGSQVLAHWRHFRLSTHCRNANWDATGFRHGARISLRQDTETLFQKGLGRRLRGQIGKEKHRVRICRGRDEGNGIDDRAMARSRKGTDEFHIGIGLGVGRIDDAEFGLAPRDEVQRIIGLRELWFDTRKDAERFERFLGVNSGRA